ncbi:MAG: hypothetical protein ACI9TV_002130 [Sulfurimonas sp.]|jgi:hypothetical protein|uniref:hypothetical protein n=1 Tax=Sulfurimonas sp. TaxID=2022749 RepID=UPI0039E5CEBE
MQTSSSYQSYLNSMKDYKVSQGRKDYQAPFADKFESIYEKAKKEDIGLSNAKDFLQNLSASELQTLQKFSGLADKVNTDTLSAEGAYNLLLHDNEHYDFNNDGVAEVGIGKKMLPIPINMPTDVRDAYISAMNALDDKDRLMAGMLSLDPVHLKAVVNNEPYTPTKMDYNYLKSSVENILNPPPGAYTSEETKISIQKFWNAFDSNYKGDKSKPDTQTEERSSEVAKFLNDLRTKGAAKFLADLNQEKIDKLVKEFEEKLIKEMGDSPQALQEIAKLVEDYKKQLLEEMHERTKEEKIAKGEKSPILSGNSLVQEMIEMQQKPINKPLNSLLLNK